jgi:hypothetical protein
MRKWVARRPSPAMAVAFIALLAALSGTAVALPGKNSVDSGDIKNGQVKGKDIAKNAVTGKKVKNSSLTGADIKNDSLTGSDINESTLGQVPSANTANNATHATSANSANSAGTAANATGLDGPLASGKTLRGVYSTAGHKGAAADFIDESSITFAVPLASAPAFHYVASGGPPTAQCPGSFADPKAAPGQLCFYGNFQSGGTGITVPSGHPRRFGSSFFASGVAAGANYELSGTWAVTAP